jgi:hypothetical protein
VQALQAETATAKWTARRLKFAFGIVYLGLVSASAWLGGLAGLPSWLVGGVCLLAAYFLNTSGRWIGLARRGSNIVTIALTYPALLGLLIKGGLNPVLFFFLASMVIPLMMNTAGWDAKPPGDER